MRDYLVLTFVIGSLPFCVFRPFIGILVWSWISYMNPHRLSWTIAYHFPVAQYVGIATLVGSLFTRDRQLPVARETIILILLWMMFTLSSFFALYPELAWNHWERVSKILLMTFLTMGLVVDRKKLKYLLLTIAFSVGFFGAKGGIFGILTGGAFRIYGPPGTFLADNNDLALALNMVLPILFFLFRIEENRKLKTALLATFLLCIVSVVLTFSRGGLVGLAVVTFLLLIKSKKRFFAVAVVLGGIYFSWALIPEKWYERMQSITDIEQHARDGSVLGRLNAWHFALNLAVSRPLVGGGFETFQGRLFEKYAPDPNRIHDAHSIYFEVLGEHGFIALGLFLALLVSSLVSLRTLRRRFRNNPSQEWIRSYCDMFEVSLLGFIASGAFLGRAYFDLFYQVIAMVVILKLLARKELHLLSRERCAETQLKPC